MSQTFSALQSGVTTFNQLYGIINNNIDAIRSQWSGTSTPGSPVVGQPFYNITTGKITIWNGTSWIDPADTSTTVLANTAEILAARGTTSSLNARLSVSLNDDGTLKGAAPVGDWWMTEADDVAFVDASTFTVSGDKTAIYVKNRALYLTQTSNDYGYVVSSSYTGGTNLTTVVVTEAIVDSGITAVEYGQPVENAPIGVSNANAVSYSNTTSGLAATDVQGAIDEVVVSLDDKMNDVITTKGDIIYGDASGAPARLAVGADDTILSVQSGQPAWINPVNGLPPGTLLMWPGPTPPSWGLVRDGGAYSRGDYADLFAVIGTTYGAGDGSTTFNVPDDRNLFARGVPVGGTVGTYQADELKSHTHGQYKYASAYSGFPGWGRYGNSSSTSQTLSAGGTETRPKNRHYLPIIVY